MTDIEFLKDQGFQILPGDRYVTEVSNLSVFLEDIEGRMNFRCCCGSPKVDFEKEISEYVTVAADADPRLEGSFKDRWLVIEIVCEDPDEEKECVKKALEIVGTVREKFDMIPACAACKRLSPVEIFVGQEGVVMLCGICKDQGKLLEKHEKMIREYHEKAVKSVKAGIEWGPMKVLIKVGFKLGLICGILMVLMYLAGLAIPILGLLPWVPGAIGGYNAMRSAVKVDYMPLLVRFTAVSISFLLTIILVAFAALNIGLMVLYGQFFYPHNLNTQVLILGGTVGVAGYLIAAAIGFFLNPDL